MNQLAYKISLKTISSELLTEVKRKQSSNNFRRQVPQFCCIWFPLCPFHLLLLMMSLQPKIDGQIQCLHRRVGTVFNYMKTMRVKLNSFEHKNNYITKYSQKRRSLETSSMCDNSWSHFSLFRQGFVTLFHTILLIFALRIFNLTYFTNRPPITKILQS